MRFSIVIPTRERCDTLYHAIRSVLAQSHAEFELVVMDNASLDQTSDVVSEFRDTRIRHVRSQQRLSMTDNWELGLSHAKGDYVFVLGDDDALLPDALAICNALIESHRPTVISWLRYFYGWSNAISPRARDRLFVHLAGDMRKQHGREILQRFCQSRLSFELMPMIYNSFVRRDMISTIAGKCGRYFCSPAPDIYSGIANAYFCEEYLFLWRGLSLSGSSSHSIGASGLDADRSGEAVQRSAREFTDLEVHPSLLAEPAELAQRMTELPEFAIANSIFRARELLFPADDSIEVDMPALIRMVAASVGRYQDTYSVRREYVQNLGRIYGIALDLPPVPPELVTHKVQGPQRGSSGEIESIAVNCRTAGIFNAADAARLVCAILPSVFTA